MDNVTINKVYNELRDINSWLFYGHRHLITYENVLVEAHINIVDIMQSPLASFLLFPIKNQPAIGKIYKDLYLVHPNDVPEDIIPMMCANENLLNLRFPNSMDNFLANRIEYMSILHDSELLNQYYVHKNLHLIGVYHEVLCEMFDRDWGFYAD